MTTKVLFDFFSVVFASFVVKHPVHGPHAFLKEKRRFP